MARWICSDDPIPEGHIRLSQAFDLYYEAVTPNWQGLDAAINELASAPADGKDGEATNPLVMAFNARDAARGAAEMKFRKALAAGELRALIHDPDNGAFLELSRDAWERSSDGFTAGFNEDFVEPGDFFQPGPPAVINGYLRPVFFKDEEFNNWIARSVPDRDVQALGEERLQGPPDHQAGHRDVHVRGRKPSYSRASFRKWVFDLMDYHDEFSLDDPEWKSQADLERAVADKFERSGIEPAESTVRALIREPLAQWRAQKAGN
jgi:hypothetical protein